MPVTSPDSIYYADGSTPISVETITAAMATSVQDALDALVNDARQVQTFVWANTAARNAQTGMAEGDQGYQLDNDTAYRYTGTVWTPTYITGLGRVVPTSVAGTGVALDSVTGIITLTNATAVTVNGCFTSLFRSYNIDYDTSGTAAGLTMQLRASGVTNTTGYDLTESLARNATSTSSTVLNQTSWSFAGGTNTRHAGRIRVAAPAVAVETVSVSDTGTHANPAAVSTANALKGAFATHRTAAAYDGFVLTFTAAQSGQIVIRGIA